MDRAAVKWPAATICQWSKTPARRMARACMWAADGSARVLAGTAGCFSFYPGKNLGAWGEAGAVATNDQRPGRRASPCCAITGAFPTTCIRNPATTPGSIRCRPRCCWPNWNAWKTGTRADAQSRGATARLLARQRRADSRGAGRHRILLSSVRDSQPAARSDLRGAVAAPGSVAESIIPLPLHLQPACGALGYRSGDFPVSERIADTVLSLPMHPHLTEREVAHRRRHRARRAGRPASR